MSPLMQVITTLGTGLFLSIVTSIVTVRLSLRQFYSQQWWENKREQYGKILEALYNIRHIDSKLWASIEVGRDLSPERKDALIKKSNEGSDEIEKVASIGAFIISDEALVSLKEFRKAIHSMNIQEISYYDYLDNHISSVDKCISEIISIARKDLRID